VLVCHADAGHYLVCWLLLATPWTSIDDFATFPEEVTAEPDAPGDDRSVLGWVYLGPGGQELGRSHELHGQVVNFDDDGRRISSQEKVIRQKSAADEPDVVEEANGWHGPRANLNAGAQAVENSFGDVQRSAFYALRGATPLHYAARSGRLEVIDLMLSNVSGQVSNVHATTERAINSGFGMGETALHMAATHGHVSVCSAILDAGALIDATTSEGWTPLLFAAQAGHMTTVDFLVARGANLLHRTSNGRSLLVRARAHAHTHTPHTHTPCPLGCCLPVACSSVECVQHVADEASKPDIRVLLSSNGHYGEL
jgi:ankyrin repeat protein